MKPFLANLRNRPGCKPSCGFTSIELLVVIAIIAMLAATVLSALAKAKIMAQGINCISNMKRLGTAAIMYSQENGDLTPANVPTQDGGDTGSGLGKPNWVDGTFANSVGFGIPETPVGCSTNPFYLGTGSLTGGRPTVTLIGSIGPYAKTAGVYKCPADHYIDPVWHLERVRSCSMNAYCGNYGSFDTNPGYKLFLKFTDFGIGLRASDCWVFLDENPLSLNDGFFDFDPTGSSVADRPAANHGNQGSFAFADGHAELHRWQNTYLSTTSLTAGSDVKWLAQHGTVHK